MLGTTVTCHVSDAEVTSTWLLHMMPWTKKKDQPRRQVELMWADSEPGLWGQVCSTRILIHIWQNRCHRPPSASGYGMHL